jgi:hypothetical protein
MKNKLKRALNVRNNNLNYSALSELHNDFALTRGDAPHVVRCLPLAIIFRAFGPQAETCIAQATLV